MASKKRTSLRQYKEQAKLLRRYFDNFDPSQIDLRKKLTPSQKAKITRYYNDFKELLGGEKKRVRIYQYSDDKKLKVQQALHQGRYVSKHLKYALAPVPSQNAPTKIQVRRDGSVTISSFGVKRYYVPIEHDELVMRREETITEILENNKQIKRWFIAAGNHEIHRSPEAVNMPPSTEVINFAIERLMQQYGADNYDPQNPNSKYFGNWLGGLIGYQFSDQNNYAEYRKSKRLARQKREQLQDKIKRNRKAMRLFEDMATKGVSYEAIENELKRRNLL